MNLVEGGVESRGSDGVFVPKDTTVGHPHRRHGGRTGDTRNQARVRALRMTTAPSPARWCSTSYLAIAPLHPREDALRAHRDALHTRRTPSQIRQRSYPSTWHRYISSSKASGKNRRGATLPRSLFSHSEGSPRATARPWRSPASTSRLRRPNSWSCWDPPVPARPLFAPHESRASKSRARARWRCLAPTQRGLSPAERDVALVFPEFLTLARLGPRGKTSSFSCEAPPTTWRL